MSLCNLATKIGLLNALYNFSNCRQPSLFIPVLATKAKHIAMKHLTMLLIAVFTVLATNPANTQQYYVWKSSSDKAFLGVNSDQVSASKAKLLGANNDYGNYVTKVIKGYAAEKAGIQVFDYVYGIGDLRASDDMDLSGMLSKFKAGDKTTVHLFRKGKALSVEVTFEKRREYETETEWNWEEKAFFGVSSLEEEDDDDEVTAGVKVEIVSNSTAESLGLKDEDVIHSINGYKMIDWSDISTAISAMKPGEKIAVEYERAGKKDKVEGTVQSQAERIKKTEMLRAAPASYAFLGIHSNEIDEEKAKKLGFDTPHGSYVSLVVKGTAAEKAGLKPFDYVYGVDDYRVSESKNLTDILKKYKADSKATVHFIRNGKKESAEVTFGKRTEGERSEEKEADKCQSPFLGVNETEGYDDSADGVTIAPIKKSTAEEMGLQRGDVITKINGARILDWTDLGVAVNASKVGQDVTVTFLRKGNEMTATKPMKSYCDTKPYTEWGWNDGEIHIFSADDEDTPEAKEEATGVMGRPEALDLSKVKVSVEDLTQQESDDMKTRYNMDMAPSNELRVNDLGLFPNPDQGAFRLQFELPEQGATSIRIYNAAGRSIYDYDLGPYSGPFSDEVDISQNGPGAYFLEIKQGTKRLTKKVVLQKVVN